MKCRSVHVNVEHVEHQYSRMMHVRGWGVPSSVAEITIAPGSSQACCRDRIRLRVWGCDAMVQAPAAALSARESMSSWICEQDLAFSRGEQRCRLLETKGRNTGAPGQPWLAGLWQPTDGQGSKTQRLKAITVGAAQEEAQNADTFSKQVLRRSRVAQPGTHEQPQQNKTSKECAAGIGPTHSDSAPFTQSHVPPTLTLRRSHRPKSQDATAVLVYGRGGGSRRAPQVT